MEYLAISNENRELINTFIRDHWFTTEMTIRGEIVDMTAVEGLVAKENDAFAGLITYRIRGGLLEITSLDSLHEGQGIGTALLEKVITIARAENCQKISLITTNDNIDAIRFYQKRGFDLVKLHYDSIKQARTLKPEIPLRGRNGSRSSTNLSSNSCYKTNNWLNLVSIKQSLYRSKQSQEHLV